MSELIGYKPKDRYTIPIPDDFNAHAAIENLPDTHEKNILSAFGGFLDRRKHVQPLSHVLHSFLEVPFKVAAGVASGTLPPINDQKEDISLRTNIVQTMSGLLMYLQWMEQANIEWIGPYRSGPRYMDKIEFSMPFYSTDETIIVQRSLAKGGMKNDASIAIEYYTKNLGLSRDANAELQTYSATIRSDVITNPYNKSILETDIEVDEHLWKKRFRFGSPPRLVLNKDIPSKNLIDAYFGDHCHHITLREGTRESIDNDQGELLDGLGISGHITPSENYPSKKEEKILFDSNTQRRKSQQRAYPRFENILTVRS